MKRRKQTREILALMGQKVLVFSTLGFIYEPVDEKRWRGPSRRVSYREELDVPRVGWVVGVRTRQLGILSEKGPRGLGEDDYDPKKLSIEDVVRVVLVAWWPNEKPVDVPVDGFLSTTEGQEPYPSTYGVGAKREVYRTEMRKLMRSDPQLFPRDDRGRFIRARAVHTPDNR